MNFSLRTSVFFALLLCPASSGCGTETSQASSSGSTGGGGSGATGNVDLESSSSEGSSSEGSSSGGSSSDGSTGDAPCSGTDSEGMCQTACDSASGTQGCEFYALGRAAEDLDMTQGFWISNPDPSADAVVLFEGQSEGQLDRMLLDTHTIPAGGWLAWELPGDMIPAEVSSSLRVGRFVVLSSSAPVEVSWEPALDAAPSGDSVVVHPTHALQSEYTVGEVSSFEVLAVAQGVSEFEWTPTVRTAGGRLPVEPVEPGEVGNILLNAGDVLGVWASAEDGDPLPLTGTLISADQPFVCVGCD